MIKAKNLLKFCLALSLALHHSYAHAGPSWTWLWPWSKTTPEVTSEAQKAARFHISNLANTLSPMERTHHRNFCANVVLNPDHAQRSSDSIARPIEVDLANFSASQKPGMYNDEGSLQAARDSHALSLAIEELTLQALNLRQQQLTQQNADPTKFESQMHSLIQRAATNFIERELDYWQLSDLLFPGINETADVLKELGSSLANNEIQHDTEKAEISYVDSLTGETKTLAADQLSMYIHKTGKHIRGHRKFLELVEGLRLGQNDVALLTRPLVETSANEGPTIGLESSVYDRLTQRVLTDPRAKNIVGAQSTIKMDQTFLKNTVIRPLAEAILAKLKATHSTSTLSATELRKLEDHFLLRPYYAEDNLMREKQVKILNQLAGFGRITRLILGSKTFLTYLPVKLQGSWLTLASKLTAYLEGETDRLTRIYRDLPNLAKSVAMKESSPAVRSNLLWEYYIDGDKSGSSFQALVSFARVEEFQGIWYEILAYVKAAGETDPLRKQQFELFQKVEQFSLNYKTLELSNPGKFRDLPKTPRLSEAEAATDSSTVQGGTESRGWFHNASRHPIKALIAVSVIYYVLQFVFLVAYQNDDLGLRSFLDSLSEDLLKELRSGGFDAYSNPESSSTEPVNQNALSQFGDHLIQQGTSNHPSISPNRPPVNGYQSYSETPGSL